MSSSRSKFFGFGSSKRKSAAPELGSTNPSQTSLTGAPQLPLPGQPMRNGPSPLHQTNSSQSSVATHNTQNTMNGPPGPQQRPPSYTGYPPGVPGRNSTTSPPMGPPNTRTPPSQFPGGPPPINTAGGGYPPQPQMHQGPPPMGGPPPPGGPPQYQGAPGYPPAQNMPQPYGAQAGRGGAVEVEGAGRSKSQLIVGIDFVSVLDNEICLTAS